MTGFWTANIEDNQVISYGEDDADGNSTGQPTTTNYMPDIRWTFTPGIQIPRQQQTAIQLLNTTILDVKELFNKRKECRDLFGSDVDAENEFTRYSDYSSEILGNIGLGDLGAFEPVRDASGNPTGAIRNTGGVTRGILGTTTNSTGGRVSTFVGANITMNSNPSGAFVQGSRDFLGVGLTDRQYRSLLLIHEFGHAMRLRFGAANSPIEDDHTSAINRANSQRVYDACFKPLPAN